MKIVQKKVVIKHNGAEFYLRPRNLDTVNAMGPVLADDGKVNTAAFLKLLLTGWSGVVDEDGQDVVFSNENIGFMDPGDASELVDKIDKVYKSETSSEKN